MIVVVALPLPPTPGDVVLGVLSLLVGAVVAATAAHLAWRSRNWLFHLGTLGGLLVVAGIVGQHVPVGGASGPWDAALVVPVVGTGVTPVFAAGVILALLCLTLVILFERVPTAGRSPRTPVHRSLEEDDAV